MLPHFFWNLFIEYKIFLFDFFAIIYHSNLVVPSILFPFALMPKSVLSDGEHLVTKFGRNHSFPFVAEANGSESNKHTVLINISILRFRNIWKSTITEIKEHPSLLFEYGFYLWIEWYPSNIRTDRFWITI